MLNFLFHTLTMQILSYHERYILSETKVKNSSRLVKNNQVNRLFYVFL